MPRVRQFKAELFGALAHPTRIGILDLLRDGERPVSDLQVALQIEASSVSQQLAVLRAKGVVEGRRVGTSVYYRVVDPKIFALLDCAREIITTHLSTLQSVADEIREET